MTETERLPGLPRRVWIDGRLPAVLLAEDGTLARVCVGRGLEARELTLPRASLHGAPEAGEEVA